MKHVLTACYTKVRATLCWCAGCAHNRAPRAVQLIVVWLRGSAYWPHGAGTVSTPVLDEDSEAQGNEVTSPKPLTSCATEPRGLVPEAMLLTPVLRHHLGSLAGRVLSRQTPGALGRGRQVGQWPPNAIRQEKGAKKRLGRLGNEMNSKGVGESRGRGRVQQRQSRWIRNPCFPAKNDVRMLGFWRSQLTVPSRAEQLLKSPSGTPVPRRVTRAPQVSGCDLNISD